MFELPPESLCKCEEFPLSCFRVLALSKIDQILQKYIHTMFAPLGDVMRHSGDY